MKWSLLVCSIALAAGTASAQRPDEMPPDAMRRQSVSFEAVQVLNADTGRTTVQIQYRIPQQFFTFTRTISSQGLEEFEAKGEISVEILDPKDLSVARDSRPIRIVRPFQPRENERLPDLQGVLTFSLPNGVYRAVTEVRDSQSGRDATNRSLPVDLQSAGRAFRIPPPILVAEPRADSAGSRSFTAVNRMGTFTFGGGGGLLLHLPVADANAPVKVQWTVKGTPTDWYFLPQTFTDSASVVLPGLPIPSAGPEGITYRATPDSGAFRTVYIPLSVQRLAPGSYKFNVTVTNGKASAERQTAFDIVWPTRPASLSNFDLAVDALQHIMSRGELDTLKSESTAEGQNHFRRFWQSRDADTSRALNPELAEYYRRVDEAIRQFSGPSDRTGYLTDQGRILILFGTPPKVERSLKPGAGRTIVWTYPRLKKMFTFSDIERRDLFVLVRVDDL